MNESRTCFIVAQKLDMSKEYLSAEHIEYLMSELHDRLIHMITDESVSYFIVGLQPGIEQSVAELLINLKKEYPSITVEFVIQGQDESIKLIERPDYHTLMDQCDNLLELYQHEDEDFFLSRNKVMIDRSDILVSIWNGEDFYIKSAINYSVRRSRTTIVIDRTIITDESTEYPTITEYISK